MPDERPETVVDVNPPGLAMSKVGDVGQAVPEVTHVAKKDGSVAAGTLAVPGVQTIVTDELVEPTVGAAPVMVAGPGATAAACVVTVCGAEQTPAPDGFFAIT